MMGEDHPVVANAEDDIQENGETYRRRCSLHGHSLHPGHRDEQKDHRSHTIRSWKQPLLLLR